MRRTVSPKKAKARALTISAIILVVLALVLVIYIVRGALIQSFVFTTAESPVIETGSSQLDSVWDNQLDTLVDTNYSEYAEQDSATPDTFPEPMEPLAVSARNTGVGNSIVVTWSFPSELEADGFQVYRSETVSGDDELLVEVGFEEREYTDTTVTEGKLYYYTVRAVREYNSQLFTSQFVAADEVIASDVTGPPAPRGVVVERAPDDATALLVSWNENTRSDVEQFFVYRSTVYGELGKRISEEDNTVTQILDKTVTPATTYYYTITAVDEYGNESPSRLPYAAPGNEAPFAAGEEVEEDN